MHRTPTPHGWVSINVDASMITTNSNSSDTGLVIRNDAGVLLAAKTISTEVCDIDQAEALAVLGSLEWSQQMHCKKLIVQKDNK